MNAWQLLQQMAYTLKAQSWPDGSADKVVGDVVVTDLLPENAIASLRVPFALLRPRGADNDRAEPKLWTQRVELVLVTVVHGGFTGERPILGANRAEQGKSAGRGLLEVEEEVLKALRDVDQTGGVRIRLRSRSQVETGQLDGAIAGAVRSYEFEALVTDERSYPPPLRLAGTDQGGGAVALTWTLQADRYDRQEVILRRASGATAPASSTAGTGVTLSGPLATSVTDTPGAGQWSYAIFAGYDEDEGGSSGRFSSGTTLTITLA